MFHGSVLAAVTGAMEGGPGNDVQVKASSLANSSQSHDSVIASYKELIKEQVGMRKNWKIREI